MVDEESDGVDVGLRRSMAAVVVGMLLAWVPLTTFISDCYYMRMRVNIL